MKWQNVERNIEDYIRAELSAGDQAIALEFVSYLREKNLTFLKDNGYWKDKIYYLVKLKETCVCFIAIKDPEEPDNHWTVWSDDMSSEVLGEYALPEDLKEIAWKHVGLCGGCGSCGGGRIKRIFGREFDRVCGCTFRFDNPGEDTLRFMKQMVELRLEELKARTTGTGN